MASTVRSRKFEQTVTDVAVLQTEVLNLHDKVDELKTDVKDLHECLDRNMSETKELLKEYNEISTKQHEELSEKVSSFEKIKWMLMGAAALLGATGVEAIQMFLAH
jgi:lipid II:glycine glycyltransferase (peptidoglycan interpeptide bridge formation enzyme)